jgi:predicted GIY-YIG superfamily endonuclease
VTVYLLHFDQPLKHATHYLGSTDNLEERLQAHRGGYGARIMEVLHEQGIGFQLVRTWEGGKRKEMQLKRGHDGRRLCPVCSEGDEDQFASTKVSSIMQGEHATRKRPNRANWPSERRGKKGERGATTTTEGNLPAEEATSPPRDTDADAAAD